MWAEPPDHAIGRSRGGLSTKIHHLAPGAGRPLVVSLTPTQAGDSPMFLPLMDKAYSSRAIRNHLRGRGIQAVIAEPDDQKGHRKRRGSRGGRPPAFDPVDYRGRNLIERGLGSRKHWRGLATRDDKLATTYRAAALLHSIITWSAYLSDTP